MHDVQWSPSGEHFVAVSGFMPARVNLFSSRCQMLQELSAGPYNMVRWNPQVKPMPYNFAHYCLPRRCKLCTRLVEVCPCHRSPSSLRPVSPFSSAKVVLIHCEREPCCSCRRVASSQWVASVTCPATWVFSS